MITLYAAFVPEFPELLLEPLMDCVIERRKRLIRYHRKEDQIRGLLGELMVRKIASEFLGTSHSNLKFMTNEYGKPLLSEGGLEFNLSHSEDWVVCAFNQMPIGIDIEKIAHVNLKLAHRFFTKEEYEFVTSEHDMRQRHIRFYTIWSAKESVIKAVGRGLSIPLHSFNVVSDDSLAPKILFEGMTWHMMNVSLDPNYSLCVCAAETAIKPTEIINMSELISYFLS